LALVEGCKHELEISIPADAVAQENDKVTEQYREKARLKGFRAGKAPHSLIRKTFAREIRQKVIENLLPRFFQAKIKEENLKFVGQPNLTDIHFHEGEPLTFKAQFEVYPEFELSEYRGVEVPYAEPDVTAEDLDKKIEEIRETKAQYVNEDPRPLAEGDYAVVSLESLSGTDEPVKADEVQVLIGGPQTMKGFNENLTGASPGDEKEFDVTYPEEYGGLGSLAGKTVLFKVNVKGLRRKELPELNDEFAKDMGDFVTLAEFREAVRKSLAAQRQTEAQRGAKDRIVDKLVDANDFAVPEAFIDKQVENRVAQRLGAEGIDPRSLNLDWTKVKEAQRGDALREVKASLILTKVAEREAIVATRDEVDREVDRIARQEREAIASVRKKLIENGSMDRIVSHIRTEKTLNFLFEQATKTAA
jgi:trigger factor